VFRVGLDITQSGLCPKYHYDNVALRGLCTYFGPGTLFCASNGVNYKPIEQLHQNVELVNNKLAEEGMMVRIALSLL